MRIDLEKGRGKVTLTIPDDKITAVLTGKEVPGLDDKTIKKIIAVGIQDNAPTDISHKKVAVIIPDDTRLWARGELFVPEIIRALFDLGVPKEHIRVIIALGTHSNLERDVFASLAGDFTVDQIEIINSANQNKDRLVYLGETSRKTPVYITKEGVATDHIIIFGGVLHHMAAGFGGGRKYIFPGIAGYDSIQKNHSLAMQADGSPHPSVRQAQLSDNPFSEDIDEAVALFLRHKTCTYAVVAVDGQGAIFHAEVGELQDTFTRSSKLLNDVCCAPINQRENFALISAGGHRTDGQLYQATKALFNGVESVKEGGKILFIAECTEGIGNPLFAEALKQYKNDPKALGRWLAQSFDMPSYVAFRVLDIQQRYEISLLSNFSKEQTEEFGFKYVEDLANYVKKLEGKGYIIPFAENILPVTQKIGNRD